MSSVVATEIIRLGTQLLACCKPSLLEQMSGFPKCTTFSLTLIWSRSGHLQSRPERDLLCIVMQSFPHDNVV